MMLTELVLPGDDVTNVTTDNAVDTESIVMANAQIVREVVNVQRVNVIWRYSECYNRLHTVQAIKMHLVQNLVDLIQTTRTGFVARKMIYNKLQTKTLNHAVTMEKLFHLEPVRIL
jgi:Ser-tRNA(Ala) deacylase AlaX